MFSPIRSSLSQCRSPRACCLNSKSWAALVWGQTCGRIESSRIQNHRREKLQTDGQTEQHYAKPHGSILLLHWSCTHDIACPLRWPKCGCICPVWECGNGIKIAYPTSRELQAKKQTCAGRDEFSFAKQPSQDLDIFKSLIEYDMVESCWIGVAHSLAHWSCDRQDSSILVVHPAGPIVVAICV